MCISRPSSSRRCLRSCREFAGELVVVCSNPGLAAMREATQTVPVVFALVGDPVGNGFVANPARPGGNATGFQNFEPAVAEKWLTPNGSSPGSAGEAAKV